MADHVKFSISISVRVLLLPVPAVAAHIFECLFSLPAKNFQRLVCICVEFGEVSCSARTVNVIDLNIVHTLKCLDNLSNAVWSSSTEVKYFAAFFLSEDIVDSLDVSLCEIDNSPTSRATPIWWRFLPTTSAP